MRLPAVLLLFALLAGPAAADGADLGVVAVDAELRRQEPCTVDPAGACVLGWDDQGTAAPGDDRLRAGAEAGTVAVTARPPLPVGPRSIVLEPDQVRLEHPLFVTAREGWSRLNDLRPAPAQDLVAFEARRSEHRPEREGLFLRVAVPGEQPVLDDPFFGVEAGTCWQPCLVTNRVVDYDDRRVQAFPHQARLTEDSDLYLRWQAEELLACEWMADLPGSCTGLDLARAPTRAAVEATLAAAPQVLSGWSLERAVVRTGPGLEGTLADPSASAPSVAASPSGTSGLEPSRAADLLRPGAAETLLATPAPPGPSAAAPAPPALPAAMAASAPLSGLAVAPWLVGVGLLALGALLYHRITKERALQQETRRRIHAAIAARPGVRIGTLQALLGLNYNTILRHVRLLERHGLVEGTGEGQRRYFVRDAALGVAAKQAALASDAPVAREVLQYLAGRGAVPLPTLRADLGLPRSSASTALARLEAAGLVRKVPDGRRLLVARTAGHAPAPASPAPSSQVVVGAQPA